MAGDEFTLTNPPIVEAILDIDCDLPPGQELVNLEAKARDCFQAHYPDMRYQLVHELQAKIGTAPEVAMRQGVQAFQFLQSDERQLVQVRAEGFSFNRLAPYTSLDDYLPEIERDWRLYVGLTAPIEVRAVRLRYINRILIPSSDPRPYLNLQPFMNYDEKKPGKVAFLNQQVAEDSETGHVITVVLATQPPELDRHPIIFDNSVAATRPIDPDDWLGILATIRSLRSVKNHVFNSTLTESCLNLFQ